MIVLAQFLVACVLATVIVTAIVRAERNRCDQCDGKGGRPSEHFMGPIYADGPWVNCTACNGSGKKQS